MAWKLSASHVSTGIILEGGFVDIARDSFPAALSKDIQTLRRLLLLPNQRQYNTLLYAVGDKTLTDRVRKPEPPLMRRKASTSPLMELVRATRTLLYKLRPLGPSESSPVANDPNTAKFSNAANRAFLNPLVSAGTQTAKRCRDAAFSQQSSRTRGVLSGAPGGGGFDNRTHPLYDGLLLDV